MTLRRGRTRTQLVVDLKKRRGYWKLEEEALDRRMWTTSFGEDNGPLLRQTMKRTLKMSTRTHAQKHSIFSSDIPSESYNLII